MALSWLLVQLALAAGLEVEIDPIDAAALEIATRTATLEDEAKPGAYLSETEAITRFQDHLFLHLIGEHGPAAEGFFALVTTGALTDAGLHRDAEWYLGESLVGLGNYKTAAARFQLIVGDASHPFRDDAVRRLLEIYARNGDREAFQRLYDAEIVPGNVKPTGLITYSLAKGFADQGDLASAKSYFGQVEPGNAWHGRALYYLGTLAVTEGDLEGAKALYQQVVDLSIETTEDRRVHDLALLALGRIAYHQGDFTAASEHYNAIGGDSAYQADKLYEIIWTSIRRERWSDALNNVEIFLLAFPEHQYSARLRLLQGHLNFQVQDWDQALGAYEQVIAEYMPVQAKFALLATTSQEGDAAVQAVLESDTRSGELPPFAVSMMRADPDLARAMDVFRDLDRQRRDLDASDKLIAELRGMVEGAGAISTYERATVDAYTERSRSIQQRLQLLGIEERWLASLNDATVGAKLGGLSSRRSELAERAKDVQDQVGGANSAQERFEREMAEHHAEADNARRELAGNERRVEELRTDLGGPEGAIAERRDAMLAEIASLEAARPGIETRIGDADSKLASMAILDVAPMVNAGELEALGADVSELAAGYVDARPTRTGVPTADRADAAHRVLQDAFVRLGTVLDAVAKARESEVGAIRDRFREEVQAVAVERQDYDRTLAAARVVSLALTREGFGRLEDFFADSVLKADMGVVDVYWAQKLEIADELVRVKEEKEEQLADLERRFELIRAKMGAPRE